PEAGEGGGGSAAGGDAQPGRDQRVLDLERARERQADKVIATGMTELEHLREALDPALNKANALAAPADGDEPQPASRRRRRHGVGGLVVNRDDGGPAGPGQVREQA